MFSHVYLGANDMGRARAFWDAVMGTLGHAGVPYGPGGVLYPAPDGALVVAPPADGAAATAANGHTLGFTAGSRAQVDAWHAAGLANGGTCDGPPGIRPNSPGQMYGAYLRDPDGNKICAYATNGGTGEASPA